MRRTRLHQACLLCLTLTLAMTAEPLRAQWAWRDANGSVQYSDTPPPSSVPQHQIIRQPGAAADTVPAAGTAATESSSSSDGATPSWVEQNAEFMKRREERREQDKKDKEQKLAAAEKKKNCAIARENLRVFESGRRIRQASEEGGMEIMSKDQRAAEIARMRDYLKDCN